MKSLYKLLPLKYKRRLNAFLRSVGLMKADSRKVKKALQTDWPL